MLALAADILVPLAQLNTVSDLAPYLAMFVLGFLVAAWGQAAKFPFAVALGILIIVGAILLFQTQAIDFSNDTSGLD